MLLIRVCHFCDLELGQPAVSVVTQIQNEADRYQWPTMLWSFQVLEGVNVYFLLYIDESFNKTRSDMEVRYVLAFHTFAAFSQMTQ